MTFRPAASFACIFVLGVGASCAAFACGGSSNDGASTADAGPDAVSPVASKVHPDASPDEPFDAGGGERWCASQGQHGFCSDFDGAKVFDGWQVFTSGAFPTSPTSVASDRSPPRAFSVTAPAVVHDDAGAFPDSFFLGKLISAKAPTSVRAALDMKMDALGLDDDTFAQSPIMLALARVDGLTTFYLLAAQLSVRASRTEVNLWGEGPDGGFGPSGAGTLTPLPIGAWVHVELELQATATGGTLTVTYDGKPAGQATLVGATTSAPTGAYLEIGARSEQFHPHDFVCAFDSVVADVH